MITPSVYLATPAAGGLVTDAYRHSLCLTMARAQATGLNLVIPPPAPVDSYIPRARNRAAHQFLKSECTHLLFVDADIDWPPDAIEKLLESGHEVVCGIYPRKHVNYSRIAHELANGRPVDELPDVAGDLVVNWIGNGQDCRIERDCIEVLYAPTGFLLVARRVFVEMAYAHPELLHVYDGAPEHGGGEARFGFFSGNNIVRRRELSEDWLFCERWRALGGRIWAHVDVDLGHTGPWRFCARTSKAIVRHEVQP